MKISENTSSQIIEELKKENTRLRHELSQIYASEYNHSIKDLGDRIYGVNLVYDLNRTDKPAKNFENLVFKIKRKSVAQLLLLIVFLLSFQNIIGLAYNPTLFKSLMPEWSAMRVVTAICFILSASSLWLLQTKWESKFRILSVKIIGIILALAGLITILVHLFIMLTGHESFLSGAPFFKNFLNAETRMAFVAAILFTGIGFVLVTLTLNNPKAENLSHAIILPILVISYFVPLSFILGRISVFSVNQTAIALYTGICFCLLGVSILLFYPGTWVMRIFTDRFTGGHMARTLTQGIIIAPIIISWLIYMGQKAEFFEPKTGMILITETYTFCFLALLWFAVRRVIKIEKIQRVMDASLRNQAHFITNITETIPDLISVLELPSRKIVYSNKEPFAKQGFNSDDLSKLTEEERNQLIYPEDRALLSDYFEKLAKMENDQVVTLEYRAKNFRGEWIWFNTKGKVFERYVDGSPKNCINVITNITGRKEAEEKSRQNEQRIQGMFDNAAIGIAELDEEGRFINVNNRLSEILGYSKEELLGKVIFDITSPEDIEHSKEINAKIHNNELQVFDYEKRYIKKDGSHLWVHVSLSAVRSEHGYHTIRTIEDVSARKIAEEALKESEEMFSAMINVLPIGIVLSDFFDRTIYKVNPAWLKIFGYSEEEEVLGKSSAELGIVRDLITQKQYLDEFIQFGNLRDLETLIFTKSGTQRMASINLDQVNIRGQKYNLASVEDITDKKGMELELKNKNEELTRFVYTVSHDLKSPLVTIKSFASFLREDIEKQDKEAQVKDLQYINNAVDKMGRLLNELIELSRIGKKEEPKSQIPMKTVAQSAIDLVAGRISQRKVQIIFSGPDTMLYGHQQRLLQLYQNLLDNAVKYMGKQSAPLIEIGSYLDSGTNKVVLFVRDNGSGIDPKYHHKIFGLFEKLDANSEGTGIGLALVKRIVEVHGGAIWFTSEGEGKGTTFYFTLEKTYVV